MSRGYRVRWVTASTRVTAEDEMSIPLALLGILPHEQMVTLLREELAADGWNTDGESCVLTADGLRVELSLDGDLVTLTMTQDREISASAHTKNRAQKRADQRAEAAEARLSREVAKELAAREPEIREGLNHAVQRVYLRALKEKAAALGTVESQEETHGDDGEVELVIRIKV